jgi:hypothetical protein
LGIIIALFFFSIGSFPIPIHSFSNDLLQFHYSVLDQPKQKNSCYDDLVCYKGSGISGVSFGLLDDVFGYCMYLGNPECDSNPDKYKFREAPKYDYAVTFTSKYHIDQINTCSGNKSCVNISLLTNNSLAANNNKSFDQYEKKKNITSIERVSTNDNKNFTLIQKCTESSSPNCLNINTETTSGSAIIDTIKKFVNSSKP